MKSNLTNKVLDGFLWMSLSKIAHIILHLIILAILARLLTPNDFGMLAASMVVINLSDIFVQIGVGPSIIIKKNIDDDFIKTAFSLSLIFGFGFGILILVFAPHIAKIFKISDLTNILIVLCLIFPIKSFSVVAESLLKKYMKFRLLAYRSIISYAIGYGLIGIILAFLDFGIWALVAATISQVLVNSVFVLIAYPHNKKLYINKYLVKELLYYGGGFTLSRIFNYTANQADNFIVARWLGPSSLGFYNRAYTLMKTPINLYGQMLHDVLFPALSSIRDKSSEMTSVFSKGTMIISVLSLPVMLLMIVLAPEIIMIFLGKQWIAAIAPFQIIAFSMYFRVGYRISNTVAKSSGIIYKNAYLQIIYTFLIIIAALIGKNWGINGVAMGVTIAIFIQFLLMSNLGLSVTTITWVKFLRLHLPALVYTAILSPFIIAATYYCRIQEYPDAIVFISNIIVIVVITLSLIKLRLHRYLGREFVSNMNNFVAIVKRKIHI